MSIRSQNILLGLLLLLAVVIVIPAVINKEDDTQGAAGGITRVAPTETKTPNPVFAITKPSPRDCLQFEKHWEEFSVGESFEWDSLYVLPGEKSRFLYLFRFGSISDGGVRVDGVGMIKEGESLNLRIDGKEQGVIFRILFVNKTHFVVALGCTGDSRAFIRPSNVKIPTPAVQVTVVPESFIPEAVLN